MSFVKLNTLFVFIIVMSEPGFGKPITSKSSNDLSILEEVGLGIFCIGVFAAIVFATYLLAAKRNNTSSNEGQSPRPNYGAVQSSKSADAPTGIVNTGSSCYLNAALQALASSEYSVKQFSEFHSASEKLELLNKILSNINTIGKNPITLSEDVEELLRICDWHKTSQQDAYELLNFVMNSVDKSLNGFQNPLKFELITVYMKDSVTRKQKYFGLSIPLPFDSMASELTKMVDSFFETLEIDNEPDLLTKLEFAGDDAPEVLLLHVQANRWNNEQLVMKKPEYKIKYDIEMEFQLPFCNKSNLSVPNIKHQKYKLVSMVVHIGTISFGHYIAVRKFKENWFLMDDLSSRKIEEHEVTKMVPYLMFYEKLETN